MKDLPDPNRRAPTTGQPGSSLSRVGAIGRAMFLLLAGGALAAIAAIAVITEMLADDFFGGVVSAMVAVFGVLVLRAGYDVLTGRQRKSEDPDPFGGDWESRARGDTHLPYSSFKTLGR